jgi:phage tail sheath protein FI
MGILLYTDTYYNKWDAPAGLNRGILNNVIDIAFNPSNTEADKIYLNSWNYAVSYPLYGIVLEGQKTFQLRKTALDRINVRRLLLYLEKNVFNVAKYFIYEANGPYLRQRFIDAVRPILEYAKNGNGISDYYIKCDEENNPQNVVDNNAIVCEIAIKPIKTLEFIILTFNCTSQSVDVKEALN